MSTNHLSGNSDVSAAISAENILNSIIAFGVIASDLNGAIAYWNEGAKRIFGWTAEEMLGAPVSCLLPVGNNTGVEVSAESRNAPLMERTAYEGWHVRKNGEQFWASGELVPLTSLSGQLLGYLKVLKDQPNQYISNTITSEENRNLELAASLRKNVRESIWIKSLDLMALMSTDGIIEDVNPAWTTILGWASSEVVGREFQSFAHPDTAETRFKTPSGGWNDKSIEFKNRYRHRDGSHRRILWRVAPLDNLLYVHGKDVTAEETREETLLRSKYGLEQAQKMEVVAQLTDGIAHDFNNMLAGILGNLEMLQLRIGQGNFRSAPRYIDAAVEVANRASALTHRLLSFSRHQTLDPKPTDVKQLVEEMTDLLKQTLGSNVSVEILTKTQSLTVLCDANHLENAILNLALNSRDAMPHGGHFTIQIAKRIVTKATDKMSSELEPGEYADITVRDTGVGMTPDIRRRSLEPFFTTKPMGQGVGLGLPIVYGFVKQSKGHLYIDSEVGNGTSVQIFLPSLTTSNEPPRLLGNVFKFPHAARHVTVFLVEDDVSVRKVAYEVLTDLGYTVAQAADAHEALALLDKISAIDLLITEAKLPNGISGLELAITSKRKHPHLPVVFLTDIVDVALTSGQLANENVQIVTKPFSVRMFAARIQSIIDKN